MLGIAVKSARNAIFVAMTFTIALASFSVASANDKIIEVLLQSADIDFRDVENYSSASTDLKTNQRHYDLRNGTKLTLSGPNTGQLKDIDKISIKYTNNQLAFDASVSELKNLLGSPISRRSDLLVWKAKNSGSNTSQSPKMKVIAGTHGTDRYVITINRQGLSRGNNKDKIKPAKKLKREKLITPLTSSKKKRDVVVF